MANFPAEAEVMALKFLLQGTTLGRSAGGATVGDVGNLVLDLYSVRAGSSASTDNAVTASDFTFFSNATHAGYNQIVLKASDWTITPGTDSTPSSATIVDTTKTTFSTTIAWATPAKGYCIRTTGTGTGDAAPKVLFYQDELSVTGFPFSDNSSYVITLAITVS